MDEALKIVELIINNNIYVAFLFLVVFLFRNPKELIQIFDAWKLSKTSTLDSALQSKYLKASSRTVIEDQLEQKHFYLCIGLNAERPIRQEIIKIHSFCAGRVKFQHFVRASNRYRFDNSALSLKWENYEHFSLWFLGIAAFASLIGSLVLILILIAGAVNSGVSINELKSITLLITVLTLTGLFYFYCWATLVSANIIRKEIVEYNKTPSSDPNNIIQNINSHSSF